MVMNRAKQPKPATQAKPGARTADGTRGNSGLQSKLGPQTRAVHGGEPERHGVNGPVVTEIIRTSTFTFSNTEEMKEWAEGKNKEIGRASCRERVEITVVGIALKKK